MACLFSEAVRGSTERKVRSVVKAERGKAVRGSTERGKSEAKALGNIALKSGADFVGDGFAGKNVKEASKARAVEAANVANRKAMNKLRSQTGSGKRAKR